MESQIKTADTAEIVPSEERKEKLVPFDFDENECDVIILTQDKEVYIPSSFWKLASNQKFPDDEAIKIDTTSTKVLKALSYYYPKYWINVIECMELDDLFLVTNAFQLKSYKLHLINQMRTMYIKTAQSFDEQLIQVFNVAQKYELTTFIEEIRSKSLSLRDFDLLENVQFTTLEKKYRGEILSTSTIKFSMYMSETQSMELRTIFHLFKMIVHKIQMKNLVSKKDFLTRHLPEHSINLESISCDNDWNDCVTLVVEDKEIYVNSFLLTSNSPVFRAMLNTTSFKEGQTKRIELPGKKFTEIVYILQYLRSLQNIDDDTNIWVLAPLCQEYQVDWLSDKIKAFVSQSETKDTKTLLRYLVLTEEMNFGMDVEKFLVCKLPGEFHLINMHLEFLLLSRRMQVWIAREKLAKLTKALSLRSKIEKWNITRRKAVDTEIVSIFEDLDQRNIEVDIR